MSGWMYCCGYPDLKLCFIEEIQIEKTPNSSFAMRTLSLRVSTAARDDARTRGCRKFLRDFRFCPPRDYVRAAGPNLCASDGENQGLQLPFRRVRPLPSGRSGDRRGH